MKITNKINSIIKMQLFVLLLISVNLSFANNKTEPTSDSKYNATDVNYFNEKPKQEKIENSSKKSSNSNYHNIMSTTGDCNASCCAGINSAQKVEISKKKSNNQKSKKKIKWFSRSK